MTTTANIAIDTVRSEILVQAEQRLASLLARERDRWQAVDRRGRVLVDAVADLLGAGGKRIRPAFCVSGYLAAGGQVGQEHIVDGAAAVEMLHAYALIHDDVMDNSPLRRGLPTVHARHAAQHHARGWQGESRRYGEGVAILAGDLALVYADDLAHGLPEAAFQVWSELRAEMIVGQHLDLAVAAEALADERLARWVALCKSGRYTIHRPLQLGATLAGRPDLASAFEEYGVAVGEAFQLRDDLLDAFGTSAASGKPTGLDIAGHKMTLLLTLAIEHDEEVRRLCGEEVNERRAVRLLERLTVIGVRDQVEARIAQLMEQARAGLERAPLERSWREELAAMAVQAAYRTN